MKVITDHSTLTGAGHIPDGIGCQDYSTSGRKDQMGYAIVCDGSSCADEKGRPNRMAKTDVGARLLALATARVITDLWAANGRVNPEDVALIRAFQQTAISTQMSQLGLNEVDMSATCFYAYTCPEGGVIHLQGDGVLALRKQNGDIKLMRWDWPNNGPFYPSYGIIAGHLDEWIKYKGGSKAKVLEQQTWLIENGGTPKLIGGECLTVEEGVMGWNVFLTAEDIAELEGIYLFSDGVGSVGKSTSVFNLEKTDWKDVVKRLLSIMKHQVEGFATARLSRWHNRDMPDNEIAHQDDLSMAAIRFNHEPATTEPAEGSG